MQSLGAPRRQVKPSQDVDRFADAMRDEASLRVPKRSALEILATAAPESAKARLHHGFTLLHLACQYGLADCASRLLLLGADPAAPSRPRAGLAIRATGSTPLMLAAATGSVACVELLAKSFTAAGWAKQLAARDDEGLGPVHLAARLGHAQALSAILAHAKPQDAWATDDRKNTPAMWAASGGHLACLQVINDAATSSPAWDASSSDGATVAHCAVNAKSLPCCEFLGSIFLAMAQSPDRAKRSLAAKALRATGTNFPHPLALAAKLDEPLLFNALAPAALACLPNYKSQEEFFRSVEFWSSATPRIKKAIELWSRASRNWFDSWRHFSGSSASHPACPHLFSQLLASCDASPSPGTDALALAFEQALQCDRQQAISTALAAQDGVSIWHKAAALDRVHGIEAMAQALDPDQRLDALFFLDHHGRTPLLAAALHGSFRACQTLLRLGADPACADPNGLTPLMAALQSGSFRLAQSLDYSFLSPADPHDGPEDLRGRWRGSLDGTSPAMLAAAAGRFDMLSWILDGLDPALALARDTRGCNLLHHLCNAPNSDDSGANRCLRLILDLPGVDPKARNLAGQSPLDLAVASGWLDGVLALAPLVDREPDPMGRLSLGLAVEIAADKGSAPARSMAEFLAQWIDPRFAEVHRTPFGTWEPPLDAEERARALGVPPLADALQRVKKLWDIGALPPPLATQPNAPQDAPQPLALLETAQFFRAKLLETSVRLARSSTRRIP